MSTDQQFGPPPGSAVTPCVLLSPHEPHGAGDWQTSWWCPGVPEPDVVQYADTVHGRTVIGGVPQSPEQLLAELEAEPVIELTTQEQLLTALDELLDNALHGDECYVNPDTVCFCVIGKLRAVLPRCEAVKPPNLSEFQPLGDGSSYARIWRCQRSAHPASPDRHVFSEA